ncbi:MAG: Dabb family protein [Bacilli bacterium]
MPTSKIMHTVAFTLRHKTGSTEEQRFLTDARSILTTIPTVQNFEVLRQVGAKSPFHFGFSMEFADHSAYAIYNEHPHHVRFVSERWQTEVINFIELDYQVI